MKRSTYLAALACDTVSRFVGAAWECFDAVFRPEKFSEQDAERLKPVRKALGKSAGVVFFAVLLGGLVGSLLGGIFGCTTTGITNGLQIVGAGVLLWGTLFVRGFEIQTWGARVYPSALTDGYFGVFPLAALLSFFAQYFGRSAHDFAAARIP
jgi:heme A synthase